MNTKGFLLLVVTVVVIGGSIGGAFSGGLALGRTQTDNLTPETALLQQFGGGQFPSGSSSGGPLAEGRLGGIATGGQVFRSEGESRVSGDAPTGFGDRSGFDPSAFSRSIVSGTVGAVDGNVLTVTTDSGETKVNLGDESTIQLFESGTPSDLSTGDRVLVIASGANEIGDPVDAASVIVNPPEGTGIFGGEGFESERFGGRQRGP